jgi:SAM-dependent methyltransferase
MAKRRAHPRLRAWRQLLANRGPWRTLRAAASLLWACVAAKARPPLPSELWRNSGLLPPAQHPFDRRLGTETGGLIWGESLAAGHPHDPWSTAYYAVAPSVFVRALERLKTLEGIDLSRYTFLDLGSGKGRAVMLAAQCGFTRVIGVELSPQLHAAACANLARVRSSGPQLELLMADAAGFPWRGRFTTPLKGELLLFLYHPFARPVLRKLLRQLRSELLDPGSKLGDVLLLYINPALDEEMARHPWIDKLYEETAAIDEEDRLADRFGSTCESFAVYRCRGSKRLSPDAADSPRLRSSAAWATLSGLPKSRQ